MIWQDSIFLHLSILVKYKLFIFFSSQMNKLIESSSSHLGAEYLVFVPSRSLKMREKSYIFEHRAIYNYFYETYKLRETKLSQFVHERRQKPNIPHPR